MPQKGEYSLEDKIRAVEDYLKGAVYDKQFKMATEKHAQSVDQSVNEVAIELGIRGVICHRRSILTINRRR